MESHYFNSVVALADTAVSPSPPVCAPSLAPVFRPSLTDFSISRILGLENDVTHQDLTCSVAVERRYSIETPSPQHSYSNTSTRSFYSDNTISTSDCDSEPDQVSTNSEQPSRKKRQRTTFSPIEVWELERAYKRRPYLTSEDEEELVQRLGIPAKSLKHCYFKTPLLPAKLCLHVIYFSVKATGITGAVESARTGCILSLNPLIES
ncbi:hypothetical protein ACROYT_G033694 [Oculina patagonica]